MKQGGVSWGGNGGGQAVLLPPWREGEAGPVAESEQAWVGVQGVEDAGGLEDRDVPQSKPACVMCV